MSGSCAEDKAAARVSDAHALAELLFAAGCPVGVTAAQALAAVAALQPAGDSEVSARSRVTGYHLGGGGGPDTFARAAGGDCTEPADSGAAAAAQDALASAARVRGGLSLAGSARPSGAAALASPSADVASDGGSSGDSALLGGGGGGAYAAVRARVCALAAAGRLL